MSSTSTITLPWFRLASTVYTTVEGTLGALFKQDKLDVDLEGVAAEYRDEINARLPEGAFLRGDEFTVPVDLNLTKISLLVDSVDVYELALR